jgi:hypothetical protein
MIRFRGFRPSWFATIVGCLLLAACADEAPGPRFASDPIPTRPATAVVAVASPASLPAASSTAPATPVAIRDLLETRGGVSTVFVASKTTIWSITSDGQAERLYEAEPGVEIRAIDRSPDARAVAALLLEAGDSAAMDVAFIDAATGDLMRVVGLEAGEATPTTGGSPTWIDWSPQGDRVLVAFQGGAIVQIPVADEGSPERIPFDADGYDVDEPAWSPTGEAIAFIASRDGGRDRALRVLNVAGGSIADVVTPPDGRFVVEFSWMPDGVSLLFTEGGEPGGAVSGIDLWQVDTSGKGRRLVASAGSVAPVARISHVRPSPDGRSVAYSVLVPGSGAPAVDSAWVRDIKSGMGFKIALPSLRSVDDIWWTDKGLVLSVTTGSNGNQRPGLKALLQVTRGGAVEALWAAPLAATPVPVVLEATPAA